MDAAGTSQVKPVLSAHAHSTIPLIGASFKLNPEAKEFNLASEEDRSLFLTFSKSFPVTESEIITFFDEKFGRCVETVYVHWRHTIPNDEEPAQFGRVVFNSFAIPLLVLRASTNTKFIVNGRSMWCKRFIPKTVRNQGQNN